jgi:putative transposase
LTADSLSAKQVAALANITDRAVRKRAKAESWSYQTVTGRGGSQRLYAVSNLPEDIRLLHHKASLERLPQQSPGSLPTAYNNTAPIESLTEKQAAIGSAKADLLMHYMRALKSAGHGKKAITRENFILAYNSGFAFPQIYQVLGEVSWKTIEGWKRTLRNSGSLATLADGRGKWRRGQSKVTAAQARILLQCALHPNRWLIAEVIREAMRRMQDEGIDGGHSPSTFRRWLHQFKEHNYDIWCFQRGGEKRWNDECCLAITRNPELINVGDVLVADGHKLNFEILNPWTGKPQRMTLIVFFDMRSNYPCGWEIMPTENSAAISAALRRAILTLGKIPRVVYLDNGRAFKANCFTETNIDLEQSGLYGVYANLGIQTVFAWPYHGQSKTVERFFGSFAELERFCPTYVGTCIAKKPPRMLRAEFVHRRVYENVMAGNYLTLDLAHNAIAAWFDTYAKRPQDNSIYLKGYAPADLFETDRGQGIDPVKLTYLMWSQKDALIRGSRIRFQGRFYYHRELEGRRHKVEIRYDLQDKSYIAVFENGRFLCIAAEQDKVHPMATHLGTDADRKLLSDYCEIKGRQKKEAGRLSRAMLEQEVLPAYKRRLEMDGVTLQGPPVEPETPEPEKLTAADEKRIQGEVDRYNKRKAAPKTDIWADLEGLSDPEKYEQLVRHSARGVLIPREQSAFMRYFEQTGKYFQLEKTGYWENVRTAEILMNRASGNTSQGAING